MENEKPWNYMEIEKPVPLNLPAAHSWFANWIYPQTCPTVRQAEEPTAEPSPDYKIVSKLSGCYFKPVNFQVFEAMDIHTKHLLHIQHCTISKEVPRTEDGMMHIDFYILRWVRAGVFSLKFWKLYLYQQCTSSYILYYPKSEMHYYLYFSCF
jgi:hypothetical protein